MLGENRNGKNQVGDKFFGVLEKMFSLENTKEPKLRIFKGHFGSKETKPAEKPDPFVTSASLQSLARVLENLKEMEELVLNLK